MWFLIRKEDDGTDVVISAVDKTKYEGVALALEIQRLARLPEEDRNRVINLTLAGVNSQYRVTKDTPLKHQAKLGWHAIVIIVRTRYRVEEIM